jgi:hypothetical protein
MKCAFWVLAWLAPTLLPLPGGGAEPESDRPPVIAGSAQPQGAPKAAKEDADKSGVRELGVKEGGKLESGFVFFDGQYLDAPYTVSRRGRQVFINDVGIFQWQRWPLPDLRVEADPGYPPGLTQKSTLEDVLDAKNPENGPFYREGRYLEQHFPKEAFSEKMATWFRGLPFVQSAEFKAPGSRLLKVRMKNGEETVVSLIPPAPDSPYSWRFTTQDVVNSLEHNHREMYEKQLKEGRALFLFSQGHPVVLDRQKAARDLGLMAQILKSDRPVKEKTGLLERMEILPPPSFGGTEMFLPLLTQFKASTQLEERLGKLVAETGIKARLISEIPEEVPIERERRLRESPQKKDVPPSTDAKGSGPSPTVKTSP